MPVGVRIGLWSDALTNFAAIKSARPRIHVRARVACWWNPSRAPSLIAATSTVALGPRTGLGQFLDAERALAGAACSLAGTWLFESRVQSARFSLLRTNRLVLDRTPFVQYVAGLLHRSLSAAAEIAAHPLSCSSASSHAGLFRDLSSAGSRVAVDPRRTPDRARHHRLRMGYVALRGATLRRAFALSVAGRSQQLPANQTA